MFNKYKKITGLAALLLISLVGVQLGCSNENQTGLTYDQSTKPVSTDLSDETHEVRTVPSRQKPDIGQQVSQALATRRASQRQTISQRHTIFLWPVRNVDPLITSTFHEQRGNKKHQAIDISVPKGTPVVASMGGELYKGDQGDIGLGRYVYMAHANGLMTYYGHLKDWASVPNGQHVPAGTLIGWSGNSGTSTGPHLHFAIKSGESFIDPLTVLNQPPKKVNVKITN